MLIRPAHLDDAACILAIYNHAVANVTATFDTEPMALADMQAKLASLLEGGYPWLVAEADGQVLGYAYAGPYRPRRAYRFSIENSVYVAEAARGQRLGSQLMSVLIKVAEAGPWQQMIAVIGDSNNAASVALHKAHGFQDVGILRNVGFKFDRWLDTVVMQRSLQSPLKKP